MSPELKKALERVPKSMHKKVLENGARAARLRMELKEAKKAQAKTDSTKTG